LIPQGTDLKCHAVSRRSTWPNRDPLNEVGHRLLRREDVATFYLQQLRRQIAKQGGWMTGPMLQPDVSSLAKFQLLDEINLAHFVGNDPINGFDRFGLDCSTWKGALSCWAQSAAFFTACTLLTGAPHLCGPAAVVYGYLCCTDKLPWCPKPSPPSPPPPPPVPPLV
jgi:hypothetical protein